MDPIKFKFPLKNALTGKDSSTMYDNGRLGLFIRTGHRKLYLTLRSIHCIKLQTNLSASGDGDWYDETTPGHYSALKQRLIS